MRCRIAHLNPLVKPLNRRSTIPMQISPLEAERLGERLDRVVAARLHRRTLKHVEIEIDRAVWIEQGFDLLRSVDVRVPMLQDAPDRLSVLGVEIDDGGWSGRQISPFSLESVSDSVWA